MPLVVNDETSNAIMKLASSQFGKADINIYDANCGDKLKYPIEDFIELRSQFEQVMYFVLR